MGLLERLTVATVILLCPIVFSKILPKCSDNDMNCYMWVAESPSKCQEDETVIKDCQKTCGSCEGMETVDQKYDIKRLPRQLHKVAFLVGKWYSQHGGRAQFPTMPKFTYGEHMDINYVDSTKVPMLNYTAFAWDNSDLTELHSENGYIAGEKNSSLVGLTTVMSNGFATVEQGNSTGHSIRFWLKWVDRISFSRDLPVRRMLREWILLNETHLESRLVMSTTTHPMLVHTTIIYKKIYP